MHAADELHVFGFADALLDEEDYEAGRDEGHGEDHADGHQDVHRGRYPGNQHQKTTTGGVHSGVLFLQVWVQVCVLTAPPGTAAPWSG